MCGVCVETDWTAVQTAAFTTVSGEESQTQHTNLILEHSSGRLGPSSPTLEAFHSLDYICVCVSLSVREDERECIRERVLHPTVIFYNSYNTHSIEAACVSDKSRRGEGHQGQTEEPSWVSSLRNPGTPVTPTCLSKRLPSINKIPATTFEGAVSCHKQIRHLLQPPEKKTLTSAPTSSSLSHTHTHTKFILAASLMADIVTL